jgi:hypothetical protein
MQGLIDVIIEVGVRAEGSVNGLINGHQCNQSMCAYKLLHNALCELQWEAYVESIGAEKKVVMHLVVEKLGSGFGRKETADVISGGERKGTVSTFRSFTQKMCRKCNIYILFYIRTWLVWSSSLEALEQAIGSCICPSFRESQPWMSAYDRPNYAK